ncbi:MAG TPA: ImmA/IrrE family metallo-endopeptidase [Candidatus Saccharimonadia bacterium]|nr:ImmA/IrrE family metallo-endopeptidase [Candidatus Saccharimonadia bacterium]
MLVPKLTREEMQQKIEQHRSSFPVSVGGLAYDLGLLVVSTEDLPEGMSGSISREGEGYVIYVNAKHSRRRQRFTIAHEIGHFVEHRDYLDSNDEILNPIKKVLLRTNTKPEQIPQHDVRTREREADNFAGDLLMPAPAFKDVWLKAQRLADVADYFGVSEMAANVRAVKLGLGYFET